MNTMFGKLFSRERKRELAKPLAYVAPIIIAALLPLVIESPYWIHNLILTFTYMIATASLRVITISGQFPLAHGAFMGIGAYVSAVPAKWFGWPIWLTVPMGGLTAMLVGVLVGYPFARLRALYYAMVSLFFGIGILQVFFVFQRWTGAYHGLTGIPLLFPTTPSKLPYYYFFLGLSAVCLFALYRFEHSRIGTSWKAIAQSHTVASSVGINEAGYRVLALAVGCFFVGIAGAAYGHYNSVLSYTSFDMLATMWLFIYVLIGGIDSFFGPILGTALLLVVPEFFRGMKGFVPYISAGILLIVAYVRPEGLVSLFRVFNSKRVEKPKSDSVTRAS